MPRSLKNKPQQSSPWDPQLRLLAFLATCVSVISFLAYNQRGEVALYGDAVAHMNIARRVFDSKTPGLLQLGTVWLPLPHLLMVPFLISKEMWKSGAGGSIPSMVAYVFAVIGIFRLVRGILPPKEEFDAPARITPWIAAIAFAANPNLIYMQSTAMGESLYLAFFIWAVVFFSEAIRGEHKSLANSALCLAAACLTRYDGWFLAAAMCTAMIVLAIIQSRDRSATPISRAAIAKFILISAAAPILWLTYNGIVYRNPLEFENGPYSAKAIEKRTQSEGNPAHPGSGNLTVSGLYFLKSAQINMAENLWLGRAWILLLLAGIAAPLAIHRFQPDAWPHQSWPLLFLLIPVPFYALSVAFSGVPIFIPPWWPFTHYNVRYGLQLLPAFSIALALVTYAGLRSKYARGKLQLAIFAAPLILAIASYASVWVATPQTLQEAQINMRTRNHLEHQLAGWLEKLPPNATILMYSGDHVGALQQAGISLKQVINEGNHRVWKQPTDPEGLWERALADPTKYADYVVAFDGDPVWQSVHDLHLRELVEIHVTGQARAILYRVR